MPEGTIRSYNPSSARGKIDTEAVDETVHFDVDRALEDEFEEGQEVKFEIEEIEDSGEYRALNVTYTENIVTELSYSSGNIIQFNSDHGHNHPEPTKTIDGKELESITKSEFREIFGNNFLSEREIMEYLKDRDDHNFDTKVLGLETEIQRFVISEERHIERSIQRMHTEKEIPLKKFEKRMSLTDIENTEIEPQYDTDSFEPFDGTEQIFFANKTTGDCSNCNGESLYDCQCDDGFWRCLTCNGSGKRECKRCDGSNASSCAKCDTGDTCSDCDGAGERECPSCKGKSGETCGNCSGEGHTECDDCHGKGKTSCDECNGGGSVNCKRCEGDGTVDQDTQCPNCNGTGKTTCPICESSGYTSCQECDGFGHEDCDRCGSDGVIGCDECSNGLINCETCDDGIIIEESCTECDGTGESSCSRCDESGLQRCRECNDEHMIEHDPCDGTGKRVCNYCDEDGQTVDYTEVKIKWNEERSDDWELSDEEKNVSPVEIPSKEETITFCEVDVLRQTPFVEFEYKWRDDWYGGQVRYESPGLYYNIESRPTRDSTRDSRGFFGKY